MFSLHVPQNNETRKREKNNKNKSIHILPSSNPSPQSTQLTPPTIKIQPYI